MSDGKRTDADGVVWIGDPRWPRRRLFFGVTLVALIGAVGFWLLQPEPRAPEPPPDKDPLAAAMEEALAKAPQDPPARPAPAVAKPVRPVPAVQKAPPVEQDEPQQEVYVDQLPPGDGTGLDAFPRPGTKQLKRGIIVPEGFALPEGYVRHYQTTDDGEQLPAILMFHPDYHPGGVTIPPDRIVPPELAPPGMPVQWLDPPPFRKDRK